MYIFAHDKILGMVRGLNLPEGSKVFDVGCAKGALSEQLSELGYVVYGAEIDENSALEASRYCHKVFNIDIERSNPPIEEKFFDAMLFADVLEHLRNPENVLRKYTNYLKDDGYVICSIPNVAKFSVRLRHLFGSRNYTKGGLLDETHLRFFTLKTARALVEDAGLKIVKMDMSSNISVPAKEVLIRSYKASGVISKVICAIFKVWDCVSKLRPSLFANQLIFLCVKNAKSLCNNP
ncbi:MAG: class I SAM-dependent methyltransferase [Candidatus Aenigmatarchaeota archaeon]